MESVVNAENNDMIDDKNFALMMILIYVVFMVVFETMAHHSFKKCHIHGHTYQFAIGVLFYACVGFCLIRAYQYEYKSMGMINVIWSSLSVLSILLIGYFYWGEDIKYMEILGAVFVVIGLILVLYDYETEVLSESHGIEVIKE